MIAPAAPIAAGCWPSTCWCCTWTRRGAVPADPREPEHPHAVHAGVGADLAGDGADRRICAAIARTAVPRKVRYRDLYRNSPLGVVAVTVSGMISAIIFSMGPVYARLSGLDTTGVATFMAVSILAAVITQYPGRQAVRSHGSAHGDRRRLHVRHDRRRQHRRVPRHAARLFLVLAALFSGFALTLYSLAVSHVNDKLEPAQMVAASSALLRLNGAAAAFGPVLAGSLMAAFGPQAYFATLATLTGALTIYDLWRKAGGGRCRPQQKGPFISAQPQGMTGQIVGFIANSQVTPTPSVPH